MLFAPIKLDQTNLPPKTLAATQAPSGGRETPSQCLSASESGEGDKSSAEEQTEPEISEGSGHIVYYEHEEPGGEEGDVHKEWRIVQGWT